MSPCWAAQPPSTQCKNLPQAETLNSFQTQAYSLKYTKRSCSILVCHCEHSWVRASTGASSDSHLYCMYKREVLHTQPRSNIRDHQGSSGHVWSACLVDPGKPSLWSPEHSDSQNGPKMLEELLALGPWSWSKTSATALQFPFEAKADKPRIAKTPNRQTFLELRKVRISLVGILAYYAYQERALTFQVLYIRVGAKKGSCRFWPQVVAMWPSANVSKVFSGWASAWTDGGPLEFP